MGKVKTESNSGGKLISLEMISLSSVQCLLKRDQIAAKEEPSKLFRFNFHKIMERLGTITRMGNGFQLVKYHQTPVRWKENSKSTPQLMEMLSESSLTKLTQQEQISKVDLISGLSKTQIINH